MFEKTWQYTFKTGIFLLVRFRAGSADSVKNQRTDSVNYEAF